MDTSPPDLHDQIVCVIDDDTSQFDICRELLASTHCSIHCFDTALGAYQFLKQHKVALILADIMMPGMDGWELHSKVRSSSINRTTAFIFTTCLISKNQEPLMSDEDAQTITLAKPIDAFKLFKSIRKIVPELSQD